MQFHLVLVCFHNNLMTQKNSVVFIFAIEISSFPFIIFALHPHMFDLNLKVHLGIYNKSRRQPFVCVWSLQPLMLCNYDSEQQSPISCWWPPLPLSFHADDILLSINGVKRSLICLSQQSVSPCRLT